jgi:hypothetical protein
VKKQFGNAANPLYLLNPGLFFPANPLLIILHKQPDMRQTRRSCDVLRTPKRMVLLPALLFLVVLIIRASKTLHTSANASPTTYSQQRCCWSCGDAPMTLPSTVFAPAHPAPHEIATCSLIRNEAPYVAEWIIYHHLLGVDAMYFFDNGSEDNLKEVLQPFIAKGWVVLRNLPPKQAGDTRRPADRILEQCNKYVKPKTRWIGSFDVDEYLVVPGGNATTQLGALLERLRVYVEANCAGVVIDRLTFGSAGHIEKPPADILQMEAYTEREIFRALPNPNGKTLHFVERVKRASAHTVNPKNDWRVCLADAGNWTAGQRSYISEPLRFHHYAKRSKAECLSKIDDLIAHGEMTWRVKKGKALCERVVQGGKGYNPKLFTEDLTLAASGWPALIRAFQEQLPLL